ncbi:pyridoxal-phosphate-dependent aminotransferase family protein [Occallatibacter riparius]|uniref:Alanine--glyoxylate aminotransferase family protein n=1 Tax=Occallatibacter riparius TaxID=1002689 RepID=A0A9J7BH01_9BACT|nr:alanine--glyoxylate aminotransferase family protein [Occallatibacter riparius]UWZ82252.1 alanine--glyoxylate aminotransferase family protein [Occallatibacter riparius]
MIRKTRLFTPGPTPLLPAAQFAMAAADMHHRTPEFRALFQRVLAQLKVFVGTQNDVLLLSSSGTGAMEAAVANLTSPGEKVLVLTAGKFGERWRDLAKAYGCEPVVLSAPYGQTFDLADVKKALTPEIKAVLMQASETSTAVNHDVQGVAKLIKEVAPEALLVVDGITGLGTTHFDVDGWGIDVLIGGSQKAVMIPPGLAYLSVSEKAWAAMEKSKNPRYYFDLRKERKNQVKGETAYTPAVALVAGLGAALDYIAGQANGNLEQGRIALVNNAIVNAAATRAGLTALGFTLFAPTSPSAAATAVAVPEGMDSSDVVKALKTRFASVIANGQGEMKGKIFRVAHLGFFDYLDTIAFLGAMEHIAKDTLKLPVEWGQAVAAAQKVYAEAASK